MNKTKKFIGHKSRHARTHTHIYWMGIYDITNLPQICY